jgi:hypothetical protein
MAPEIAIDRIAVIGPGMMGKRLHYQHGLDTKTPSWHTRNNCRGKVLVKHEVVVQMATGLPACDLVG